MKERYILSSPYGGQQASPPPANTAWIHWPRELYREVMDASDEFGRQRRQWTQTLLRYQGRLNRLAALELLHETEDAMLQCHAPLLVKKRVFLIAEELLANLLKHADDEPGPDHSGYACTGTFALAESQDSYIIMTKNRCLFTQSPVYELAAELNERFQRINSLDKEDVKSLYRDIIKNGGLCGGGPSQMGFVAMARKASEPIYYTMEPVTEKEMYFAVMFKVAKKPVS